MSCTEYKTVLRAEIKSLQGKKDNIALDYFKPILGEPSEIDECDGEILYFDYDGKFQPVYDYDNEKWGIDLVIHHRSDYKTYVGSNLIKGIYIEDIHKMANELSEKFNVEMENIKLLSYDWYNSGDEPVYIE